MSTLNQRLRIKVDTQHIGYLGKGENFHLRVIDLRQLFLWEMAGFFVYIDVV